MTRQLAAATKRIAKGPAPGVWPWQVDSHPRGRLFGFLPPRRGFSTPPRGGVSGGLHWLRAISSLQRILGYPTLRLPRTTRILGFLSNSGWSPNGEAGRSTGPRPLCLKRHRCLKPEGYLASGSATTSPTREKGGANQWAARQGLRDVASQGHARADPAPLVPAFASAHFRTASGWRGPRVWAPPQPVHYFVEPVEKGCSLKTCSSVGKGRFVPLSSPSSSASQTDSLNLSAHTSVCKAFPLVVRGFQ